MLLVFWIVFLVPVISRIESIGGGWVGGKWGRQRGRVRSHRRVKAPIRTQRAVPCPQYVTQTGRIHKRGQDCREEQFGTPYSPINALQGHEMHPGGLTRSVKSRL